MKILEGLAIVWMLSKCAPSDSKQYLFSKPKGEVTEAVKRLSMEFKYESQTENGDTTKIEKEKVKGRFIISDIQGGRTMFIPQIDYPGINKRIYQDFIYGCLKEELENPAETETHKEKTFGKFLVRNTISPIWGSQYIFENDPFNPKKAKQVIFALTGALDLTSVGMIIYGSTSGRKTYLSNGVILFALVRGLNGMNFGLTKTYNQHLYLKYNFDNIQVQF